jgi:hypothetical protein
MNLLTLTLTAAIGTAKVTETFKLNGAPRNLTAQFNLIYGSGGATVDAYLQTSLDGGTTWIDIINFHGTTAAATKVYNLNSQTPVTTAVAPTDGTMTANTSQDGILGPIYRVKYKSSGTYAATTLAIDVTLPEQAA